MKPKKSEVIKAVSKRIPIELENISKRKEKKQLQKLEKIMKKI